MEGYSPTLLAPIKSPPFLAVAEAVILLSWSATLSGPYSALCHAGSGWERSAQEIILPLLRSFFPFSLLS